jgi:hypothetical protein
MSTTLDNLASKMVYIDGKYQPIPKKGDLWAVIGTAEHYATLAYEELIAVRDELEKALSDLAQHDSDSPLFAVLSNALAHTQSAQAHIRAANVPEHIQRHMPATLLKEGGEQ